ncbi:MAG: hypothetical protein DRP45_01550, partial [Candidatus Zixiibacteriota bacterium]
SFFVNLAFGFVVGIFYALMLVPMLAFMGSASGIDTGDLELGGAVAGIVMIMMPFVFAMFAAVFNTLLGLVMVPAYNLIVKMTGGLEFELNSLSVRPMPAPTPKQQATQPSLSTLPPPPPPGAQSGSAPPLSPQPPTSPPGFRSDEPPQSSPSGD